MLCCTARKSTMGKSYSVVVNSCSLSGSCAVSPFINSLVVLQVKVTYLIISMKKVCFRHVQSRVFYLSSCNMLTSCLQPGSVSSSLDRRYLHNLCSLGSTYPICAPESWESLRCYYHRHNRGHRCNNFASFYSSARR